MDFAKSSRHLKAPPHPRSKTISKSDPRMETMMEPMHPRRLEKKANIESESALRRLVDWLDERAEFLREFFRFQLRERF